MHLISAVIFSRAFVLVILDLPFDFSDRTKTLEQMAPCLAGSDLLQILCWCWVNLRIFERNLGAEGGAKTKLRMTDCFWSQFRVELAGGKGPNVSQSSPICLKICLLHVCSFFSHVLRNLTVLCVFLVCDSISSIPKLFSLYFFCLFFFWKPHSVTGIFLFAAQGPYDSRLPYST